MSGSLAIIGSVLQGTATVVAVQYREDIAGTYWKVLPQWQCDIERIPPEKQGDTERVLPERLGPRPARLEQMLQNFSCRHEPARQLTRLARTLI